MKELLDHAILLRRMASLRRMITLYVYEHKIFAKVWAAGHDGWQLDEIDYVYSLLVSRRCRTFKEDYSGASYIPEGIKGRPYRGPRESDDE